MSRAGLNILVGTKLTVHMSTDGRRGMTFKPTVLAATPNKELRWLGKLTFGGIADGEHFFVLDRNADGTTHLTREERYSGALVALTKPFLNKERETKPDTRTSTRALKHRVEHLHTQPA